MKTINEGFENVPLANLKPHPRNVNQGDFGAIHESIEQNGFFGAVTANRRTGHILAGNHRYKVAQDAHAATIPVIWVDVDEEAELRILLADNRTARLGHDDESALAALLSELALSDDGLKGTGFDGDDLDEIIGRMAGGVGGGSELLTDPDEVPENAPTRCKSGDLWQLGRHRLLCGDSTKREDVERLMGGEKADCMWTDPPYGVSYVGKTAKTLVIENDGAEGLPALLKGAFACATEALVPGAPFYIAHPAGALCLTFGNAIIEAGWRFHQTLIWCKDAMVLGHSDYHFRHEPIYYGWTAGEGRSGRGNHEGTRWHGDNSQVSVFHVDRPKRSEDHPTSKPVLLIEMALDNSTRSNGIVYEPFCGSGSTLIACETKGRNCRALELSPRYCDVILARWEKATGQTATLLEAGNGN